MYIAICGLYLGFIGLTLIAIRHNREQERMRRIMEAHRPLFAALKMQQALKRALRKTKDDIEFSKMMERNFDV